MAQDSFIQFRIILYWKGALIQLKLQILIMIVPRILWSQMETPIAYPFWKITEQGRFH
ncbi:hypothetical protein TRIP_C90036 [Candidatus Zixiibacteriota bacterium]|nr:hypothetical protein TRIP_C90036 [candidate division Zixibacteria bacterium]